MSAEHSPPKPMPAVVSRAETRPGVPVSYLLLTDAGAADWTGDLARATTFASMREAARMALRLPASVKAYGLPRNTEMALN